MDVGEIVAGLGSTGALENAAQSAGISTNEAQDALQGVLSHFTGGGSLEGLVETVAARAGISQSQVQAFLPQVMPMLQAHSANASEGVQSVLGGVLNSLSGAGGTSPESSLAGLAKGLFG